MIQLVRAAAIAAIAAVAVDPAVSRADAGGDARVPRQILLAGIDTPVDPAAAGTGPDSPAASSGAFDAARTDLGEDDDLAAKDRTRSRAARTADEQTSPADKLPDPLRGSQPIDPSATGPDAAAMLAKLLPPRTDSPADWQAPLEPLHFCGEPRLLPPCVPLPPCHPSEPPWPYDLVGVRGAPTCGPIYRGPCVPRTGSHDDGPLPRVHRVHDRLFDWFYNSRLSGFQGH